MQFLNLLIVHLVYFSGIAAAFFLNSAPTFIKCRYETPELINNDQFLFKTFKDFDKRMSIAFKEHDLDKNAKLYFYYYQITKREWESRVRDVNDRFLYIPRIVYLNQSETVFSEFKNRGVLPEVLSGDSINEVLERSNIDYPDDYVIQIIPDFKQTDNVDAAEDKMENLYYLDDKLLARNENKEDVSVEQEIDADFAEANRLAAEEDQPVTILEDVPSNSTTVKHDNLFTNYQFFTTGIWSGLIVSGFLLLILYGALTWLSDLQITYASFEKQVDFDKKNE